MGTMPSVLNDIIWFHPLSSQQPFFGFVLPTGLNVSNYHQKTNQVYND